MAYQTLVGTASFTLKPFAKFKDGESVEGYFTGMVPNKLNPDRYDLNFETVEGQVIRVPRAGKLHYLEQNLAERGNELKIGAMTRLTRTGSYTPKGKNFESPYFSISQDLDNIKDSVVQTAAADTAKADNLQETIAKLRAGN